MDSTIMFVSVAQGRAVGSGQSDVQRVVMVLQLCAGLAVCKIMSDIATRTLEGADACYLFAIFPSFASAGDHARKPCSLMRC